MSIRSFRVAIIGMALVCLVAPGAFAHDVDDHAITAASSEPGQIVEDMPALRPLAPADEPTVAEEEATAEPDVATETDSEVKQAQAMQELPPTELSPVAEEIPLPVADLESSLDQLPDSGGLDLLDSGEQMIDIGEDCYGCGEYGCDSCEVYEGIQEECFAECGRFWIRGDYLMWFAKGGRVPPLLTTSPAGFPIGILGQPNTDTLFGGTRENSGGRNSVHLKMGYWLDDCETLAMEGDYLDLGRRTASFSGISDGATVFARPYHDPAGNQLSRVVAYPGQAVGLVEAEVADFFESAGFRLRRRVWRSKPCYGHTPCASSFRLDLISGYRYYRLVDRLTFRETRVLTGPALGTTGTMSSATDTFRTSNEFNGGEFGLIGLIERGRWSLEMKGKMSMGNHRRVVLIEGATAITAPGQSAVNYNRGVLALPSNSGLHTESEFVIIPQFGMEIGYQLNSCVRAYAGYNFLYWANVARAGDQVDLAIDATQFPPTAAVGNDPTFASRHTDFWAQGVNVGLEFRF